MFIHWGIYSIPARGEWTYASDSWKAGEYEAFAKVFNPTNYNPREWAKLAKRAGMKYAVLTSRHHDGFCMFDSHFTDYKITNTPYGRDIVREYVEAFRAEGLKVGFYHSLPDWTHPGYSDPETPAVMQGRPVHKSTPEEYAAFKELVANHVRQLMTEYGKIDLLFLDYTSKYKQDGDYFDRERLLKIAYENQPGIIVNDRLSFWKDNVRDFDYYTPEICVPSKPIRVKGREVPWETCATINGNWGYCAEDNNWKTPEALVAGLVGCVSRDGNLLLNVGPMSDGKIPAPAVERLNALGDWYAANGESIFGCGKSKFTPPFGCAYTQ
jgi:alpha-L-fucosidase